MVVSNAVNWYKLDDFEFKAPVTLTTAIKLAGDRNYSQAHKCHLFCDPQLVTEAIIVFFAVGMQEIVLVFKHFSLSTTIGVFPEVSL